MTASSVVIMNSGSMRNDENSGITVFVTSIMLIWTSVGSGSKTIG